MDIRFNEQEQAFRKEVTTFLDKELPKDWSPGMPYEEAGEEKRGFQKQFVKKLADKRETSAKRDWDREKARLLKMSKRD